MNDNFEMGPIIEASLFSSILYADDLAYRWHPVRELPRVVLDPKFSFGRAVIEEAWVPTDALYSAFEAEKSTVLVANDFEIDQEAVNQAIAFEEKLRGGAGLENQAVSHRGDRWRLPINWTQIDHTKMEPLKDPRFDESEPKQTTHPISQASLPFEKSD
jgi:uncharacterized protein (DUF433 family)